MKKFSFIENHLTFKLLTILSVLFLFSCNEYPPNWSDGNTDGIVINGLSEVEKLSNAILQEVVPLSDNPMEWTDEQLSVLAVLANKKIVGLGEATHGTSEFFKAKHRIFKYLVENHDYKLFIMEADFGESYLINKAIWEGRTSDLKTLMSENMHFWTWHTNEVKDLLEWMSEYNKNRPENERLVYVGIDCQFNDANTKLLSDFLLENDAELHDLYINTLAVIRANNPNLTTESYNNLIAQIDQMIISFEDKQDAIISSSSLADYKLYKGLIDVIKRGVSNQYHSNSKVPGIYGKYRDDYMAQNTKWLFDYYENAKTVLWAHNSHIANDQFYTNGYGGSLGNHLSYAFLDDYANLGFTFSKGWFNAMANGVIKPYQLLSMEKNSVNDVFSRIGYSFVLDMNQLGNHAEWTNYLKQNVSYLFIGSGYNGYTTAANYVPFSKELYSYMIHFHNTSATNILNY